MATHQPGMGAVAKGAHGMRNRVQRIVRAALTPLLAALALGNAGAQGILYPGPIMPTPMPRPWPGPRPLPPPFIQPFYVKDLRVTTTIRDAVAETTVQQTFVNTASVPQEGTYLYPLPEGAMPTAFSMTIGDRTVEPKLLTHDEARAIYEGYVRRYRDPALLEYVGRNMLQASVYPIPPQGERTLRMRYTEVVKPQSGIAKYTYPLSTSRFGARPVGVASVVIKLQTSSPIKNVYSPTHDLGVRKIDDFHATASWEGANDSSDRDLTLFFSTGASEVGLSALTYRSGDRDGYFTLLASPRVKIDAARILPKRVVFVLDRTGSMNGKKIEQARKSLLFCLNSLRPSDRFDVITFNESADVLSTSLMEASEANVAKARHFVENIEAAGGTNIDEAMRAAMKLIQAESGEARMVVFLTDGLPTVGETNINTILQHVREMNGAGSGVADQKGRHAPGARIFCFGLGYDVNVPFLDRLANEESGDSDYVRPEEDVEAKVSSFFAKVSSPVLSDVRLAFDGGEVYDIYPKVIPDLFKGSQLVITGRFRGKNLGPVRLIGRSAGAEQTFALAAQSGEAGGSNDYLPRLWAARKLGYLVDQVRLSENPAGKQEILDEIIRLSREYGIITEYTSFLIDEDQIRQLGLRDMNGTALAPGAQAWELSTGANGTILREEIRRRSLQFGSNGAGVTNQSARANDLRKTDQVFSRYQNSLGSVDAQLGRGGLVAGKASHGNALYDYALAGSAGPQGTRGLPAAADGANGSAAAAQSQVVVQAVGDRTFYRQANNVWQDGSYDPKKQVTIVKVKEFSDAHFALLKAIPSLAAYSSVGDEIIIRVGSRAVQIGPDGKADLTDAEMKQLVGG